MLVDLLPSDAMGWKSVHFRQTCSTLLTHVLELTSTSTPHTPVNVSSCKWMFNEVICFNLFRVVVGLIHWVKVNNQDKLTTYLVVTKKSSGQRILHRFCNLVLSPYAFTQAWFTEWTEVTVNYSRCITYPSSFPMIKSKLIK